MPTFTSRRRYRAFPKRRSRARSIARGAAMLLGVAVACSFIASRAHAGAGSGDAILFGPNPATAGQHEEWTVQYHATESFAAGSVVEIQIPPGWSSPQSADSVAPGYFAFLGDPGIDSVDASGHTIRVHLSPPFAAGSYFWIYYGIGGGNAYAHAQTAAQDSVFFRVRSDPQTTGTPAELASSPFLSVVADPAVVSVDIVDAAGIPVDTMTKTTDQDTTRLFLRGYDAFGNFARLIPADWSLSGGVGAAVPASGTSTALRLDRPGLGVAHADSAGVWTDSTGTITVLHGAYTGLEMTAAAGPTAAGASFPVTARAFDLDGNTMTDGPGSAVVLGFTAFADSVGSTPAEPSLVDAGAGLTAGAYAGTLTARSAGTFWLAVRDTMAGYLSARHPVTILAAPPDHVALAPDTLRLVAGTPDSVAVRILDPFGNRTALLAPETLTLWTDRTSGTFRDLPGSTTLFEITVPAGADSARFTFTDTRTTSTEGRIRAIDANGASPFLGTAGAPVFTAPGVPAAIALTASPDTAIANGADSVLVSGSVLDAFGNPVALGERFTLTGSASPALTPVTDEDPSTPGAQLLADAAGAVRGYVRVGTAAGSGGATVTALRAGAGGPATGTATIRLLAGTPSGPITLSAAADSLAADSLATLSIGASGLHDLGGNAVQEGEMYTVTSTLGAILTADAAPATPGSQVEALAGAISFTLLGGDVLGNAIVSVKAVRDTASTGSLSLRLVPGTVDGSRSLVDAASPAPVGPAGSVIHVSLFDRQDHPIPGVPAASVSVTVTGLAAAVSAIGAATDPNGRIDFRATTTVADTGIVHVTARGVPLANQPAVVFTAGPLDHYTIAGPPGPLTAGVGASLAVSAFDGFGNAMPAESGEILTPTVTAGAATVPSSVTLAGGTAVFGITPTQATPLTIQVTDGTRPAVTYGPVSVNPSGAATLTLAPDSLTLTPTQVKLTTATVRDAQGNPVQGQLVTFYLGGPSASGALESSGSTSGGPGSQSGITNSSGKVTVRYHAPVTAPAVDSIFVSGGAPAPVGIRAITSPGATASLRVLPASLAWTAGVPESVRVLALDAFGNRVTADGALVTMRPSGAVAWNPASGAMTAGQLVVTGADTLAETIAIDADRSGGGTGSGGTATVIAAPPSGAIAIAATRDTLTADGHSASTVTLGPVHDRYGNLVGFGALIGVTAQTGTLVASDASVLFPGLDLATGADSRASVVLVSAATPGLDTLRAVSRAGSASGAHGFVYQDPPSLVYVAGTLAPGSVTPGGMASFALQARNTGPGSIQLGVGSSVSFGSGVSAFSAPLGSAVAIGSGVTATLTFAATLVPASLPPGSYAPSFRATGTDPTGSPFDFFPSLAGAEVSVLGVGVTAVSAAPDPVPLGYGALSLVFDVRNVSGTPGDLTGASVGYSTGAFLTGSPSPPLGTTIPAGATTRFTFTVQVPASGIAPGTIVGANLQATLTYGGNAVLGASATPISFRVVSAAQVAAVGGSGSPSRLLRGRTAAPSVRVTNSGAASVTLSRGATRLLLDRGGSTVSFTLAAATAVGAGDQATLGFDSLAVPALTAKGRYRARLFLDGVESGQSFVDSVAFAPDSLEVVDPALLAVVPGSLAPATVSAGQTRPVSLTIRNDGDVPFAVDPSTLLRFGAPVSTSLATTSSPTINAGQSLSLTFGGGALGSPASPGDAATELDLLGLEDGVARAQALAADSLHARAPAVIQYVARTTAPSQIRPGQTIDVSLDVRNTGGSPFTLDPATSSISLSDGTDLATGLGSGTPVLLAPAGQVTLQFPALSIPAAMASQPYRVDLALSGVEWGLAHVAAITSPDSEVVVLDPLAGLDARSVDTTPPVQVSPGSPPVRVWGLSLTPLAAVGSATSYSLRSVAITVLTDGSTGTAPAGAVASIALRDGAGMLVAQAAPGPSASNPVVLALAPPILLGNAAESLYVEATFRAGTTARGVAFRLAQAGDVVAVDVTTSSTVPILGGGGLPFVALTSPEITFFDRPHGYPNPFRAGTEAILLSYVLGQDAAVKVSIYTLFGDLVREIAVGAGARGGIVGLNEIPWDGRNGKGELVRPGVYVARIDGPGVSEKIKVGVLR